MPYATVDDLAEYMEVDGFGAGETRAEVILDVASDLVVGGAPLPADATPTQAADYARRAANGEKVIAEWLLETKGYISGESLSGVASTNYASDPAVLRMVKAAMGPFVETAGSSGVTSVAMLSTWPPR